MNVEGLTEIFEGQGRTLDVPAGTDLTPFGIHEIALFELLNGDPLEKGKVGRGVLFVFVQIHRGSGFETCGIHTGKASVIRKLGDVKIDRGILLVGQALFQESAGKGQHVLQVFAHPGIVSGRFYPEKGQVFEKLPGQFLSKFPEGSAGGLRRGQGLVVEIGKIDHVRDLEPPGLQPAAQNVRGKHPPVKSEVWPTVEGGATGVDTDLSGLQRLEDLLFAGEGVGNPEILPPGRRGKDPEGRREVTFPAVGEDDHDEALLYLPGHPERPGQGRPGTHADKNPFLPGQPSGQLIGFLIVHVDHRMR